MSESFVNDSLPASISHDLHDYSLRPLAVEFGIEHPLPGAQIELACGDRQDDFVVHQNGLEMRVAIVLAGLMMAVVLADGARCSSHWSMSSISPDSLSFTYTPAVMCMADTSTMPSRTALAFTMASILGVMCTYSRCCLVLKVRYSV